VIYTWVVSSLPFGADSLPFRIATGTPIPPYEQIRGQLTVMIDAGRVEPGTRLPTIRALAAQLGLAPGTVARAYRELELDGTVEGRGRQGTFVSDDPPDSEAVTARRMRLADAAAEFVSVARRLRVSEDQALSACRDAFMDQPN